MSKPNQTLLYFGANSADQMLAKLDRFQHGYMHVQKTYTKLQLYCDTGAVLSKVHLCTLSNPMKKTVKQKYGVPLRVAAQL